MSETYHLPDLSRPDLGFFRAPGPGLGNLLFPIARALIAQNKMGGTLVLPTMRQVKIGPYIRREKDKRHYGDIFRRRSLQEISHWAHAKVLRKRLENESDTAARVIRYVGLGRQFHDLRGYEELVRRFLEERSQYPVFNVDVDLDIAIHVRLGDFSAPNASATKQGTQSPLDWYRSGYAKAQDILGVRHSRCILFTDENPNSVITKLGLKGITPEPVGNALTSLLLMSRAKVLIGSRSTFSLWGQYLGDTLAVWPKGFELSKYKHLDDGRDIYV